LKQLLIRMRKAYSFEQILAEQGNQGSIDSTGRIEGQSGDVQVGAGFLTSTYQLNSSQSKSTSYRSFLISNYLKELSMHNKITKKLLIGASMLATATGAFAAPTSEIMPLTVKSIAVFGDSPYGLNPTDNLEVLATPAFIDSINADLDVSLVLHVGDIHSGKSFCTEAYDQTVFGLWNDPMTGFFDPLVYTPGDNEWSDCHKTGEGGGLYNAATGVIDYKLDANGFPIDYASGDPIANLDLVRSIFFSNPGHTLGDSKLVLSQAQVPTLPANKSDRKYVENVMWMQSRVLFVTVNIPGGSNNDNDIWYGTPTISLAQTTEIAERTAADQRWLDYAYFVAKVLDAKAMVIQEQADMWDLDGKPSTHIAEYKKSFIDKIAVKTKAFGKPVLLINGDSHKYRSDNPLKANVACVIESGATETACADDAYTIQSTNLPFTNYDLNNFHRIVVHGSTFPLEWLKLSINTSVNVPGSANAFGPFIWERKIQP